MGKQRRLVLHIGMGKTGSTALQIALARSRAGLADNGINYPSHSSDAAALQGKVMTGNGRSVLEAIGPRSHVEAEARRARREILEQATKRKFHTTLYSSELLYAFSPKCLEEVRDELAAEDVQLQVVLFVRNIAGHAISSYSQAVKRSLYAGTFRDYIDPSADGRYQVRIQPRSQRLLDLLGADNLRVLHYDSIRDQVVQYFLSEVLGLDPAALRIDNPSERFNRSLTADEIRLMRYMNRSLADNRQARVVSDILIDQEPLGRERLGMAPDDLALLRELYADQVEWVNSTFFPGHPRLQIDAQDVLVSDGASAEAELTDRERFLLTCLVQLAGRGAPKQ